MDLLDYVVSEALVLVPALWVLGAFLKATPKVPDWWIPWVLLSAGTGLTYAMMGPGPDAWVQGILVTGAAVLGHQLLKQTMERE